MRANSIGADASTLNAMGLLGLTFVRTSELIAVRWEELDLEEALWTIPAERMKDRRGNRREQFVPLLSRQVASLFQAQHAISGPQRLWLPEPARRHQLHQQQHREHGPQAHGL